MQLVFENFETTLSEANQDLFKETVKKAFAIVDNAEYIENYKQVKGLVTRDNIGTITVYTDDYPEEFYIDLNVKINPKGSVADAHENSLYIEVLSKESAEENEIEYMEDNDQFTKEEKDTYELGKTVQWYLPLGDSGYWYCLK